jgi:hypothetical protein
VRHPAARRLAAALLAATLFGSALPARALPLPKFSVAAGYAWPVAPGSFTDFWNAGAAVSAGVSFRIDTRFALWAEAGAYRHGFDAGAFASQRAVDFQGVQVTGNDVTIFPVTAGVEYSITGWGNTRPYVTAGGGFYQVSVSDANTAGVDLTAVDFPDITDQAFGVRGGFGVRTLVTPRMTLFADVTIHYAWVSPDPLAFMPLRAGLRF